MELQTVLIILALFFALLALRKGIIDSFKIGYYETKLENRGVDISKVKNFGLLDVLRS